MKDPTKFNYVIRKGTPYRLLIVEPVTDARVNEINNLVASKLILHNNSRILLVMTATVLNAALSSSYMFPLIDISKETILNYYDFIILKRKFYRFFMVVKDEDIAYFLK